jgi:thiol-disulfide isomerase/thioredoxin/uncharacterized CHY-type Zn-finger protein
MSWTGCGRRLLVRLISVMRYHPELLILVNSFILPMFIPYFSMAGKTTKKLYVAFDDHPIFDVGRIGFPDIFNGSLDRLRTELQYNELTLVYVYAPWSIDALDATAVFEKVSRQFQTEMGFVAINCWTPNGQCKNETRAYGPYPRFAAISTVFDRVFFYQGDHTYQELSHFIGSLLSPYTVVNSIGDLRRALGAHPTSLVLLGEQPYPSQQLLDNFISARYSLHLPNTNNWSIPQFLIVTNSALKKYLWQFDAGNEPDTMDSAGLILVYRWNKVLRAFSVSDATTASNIMNIATKHASTAVQPLSHSHVSLTAVIGGVNSTNDALLLFSANPDIALQFHRTATYYATCHQHRKTFSCQSYTRYSDSGETEFCSVCSKSTPPLEHMSTWTGVFSNDKRYCSRDFEDFSNFCQIHSEDARFVSFEGLFDSISTKHSYDGLENAKCASNSTLSFAFTDDSEVMRKLYQEHDSSGSDYMVFLQKSTDRSMKIDLPSVDSDNRRSSAKEILEKFLVNYHYNNSALDEFAYTHKHPDVFMPEIPEVPTDSVVTSGMNWNISNVRYLETVTTETFDSLVLGSSEDYVLLHYSTWCGFCRSAMNIFTQASVHAPNVTFAKINSDLEILPENHMVGRFPTIVLYPGLDKNFSYVFPEHIGLTVPNLVGFVRVYADYSW